LTNRQTLSKRERLKSYKRIRILFAQGQKFKVFPLVVYFLIRDVEAEPANKKLTVEGVEEVEGDEGLREVSLPANQKLVNRGRSGLKSLHQVDSVEAEGEILTKPDGILQMGVSVGKRHFKRAVDRNLLKRRIREAYRKQKHELRETLIASGISMDIFFVYSNARISDYAEIETAMTNGMSLLKDKIMAQ